MIDLGWNPSTPAPQPIAFVDPIEGEQPEGVPIYQHPELIAQRFPHLWELVDRWRCGLYRRLRPRDWSTLSNFEIECLLILRSAEQRAEKRALDALKKKQPE